MARTAGNDRDINRLNETLHYAEAVDFARPHLLLPRQVSHTLLPSDAIVLYLRETGFGDTVPLRDFTFDNALITVFVERWRPETHTFHLPWGEVVRDEDVAVGGVAVGCQASGGSTTGGTEEGVVHAEARMAAGSCPPDAPTDNPETLRQYARCYIMLLIEGYLMTDKSNNLLHSVVDILDIPKIFSVVSTGVSDLHVSYGCEVCWTAAAAAEISMRPGSCNREYQSIGYNSMRPYDDPAMQALCRLWFVEEEE
ncbi:uncharacterized protein DS421_9g272840 [Arachis hypogaea]|nr:uncharacterized protein DS421_9g272840 [Arachis hypogaea]